MKASVLLLKGGAQSGEGVIGGDALIERKRGFGF
jgi:hypothetical protein